MPGDNYSIEWVLLMYTGAPSFMWSRIEQFFVPLHVDDKFTMINVQQIKVIMFCPFDSGSSLHMPTGKKLLLVCFYLYICHWILDVSIIYSEISPSKYHVLHVDYIDKLQHDLNSLVCSSMKPVNRVYSLIVNLK